MPRRVLVACLLTPLACLPAAAQDAPSKAPAPSQAQVPDAPKPADPPAAHSERDRERDRDDHSPKATLKQLAAALRDGDADRIRQVMHATTTAESRMVSAMADMARAMAAMQKSAVKAFGKEAAKEVVGDTDATDAESNARIDAADVKVQGDTATVSMEDGDEAPVVLKRVDGRWKLPMSELSRGADAAALDERLTALAEQSRLVRTLAAEIESGKYATPAQAHEAWQSRAMQASTRRPTPPVRTKEGAGEKVEDRKIDK